MFLLTFIQRNYRVSGCNSLLLFACLPFQSTYFSGQYIWFQIIKKIFCFSIKQFNAALFTVINVFLQNIFAKFLLVALFSMCNNKNKAFIRRYISLIITCKYLIMLFSMYAFFLWRLSLISVSWEEKLELLERRKLKGFLLSNNTEDNK